MQIEQKIDSIQLNIDPYLHQENQKSKGMMGNITIYFPKTFNWLQRFMWKTCFGLDIKNMEE